MEGTISSDRTASRIHRLLHFLILLGICGGLGVVIFLIEDALSWHLITWGAVPLAVGIMMFSWPRDDPAWMAGIKTAIALAVLWASWYAVQLATGVADVWTLGLLFFIAAPQLGVVLAAACVGWLLGRSASHVHRLLHFLILLGICGGLGVALFLIEVAVACHLIVWGFIPLCVCIVMFVWADAEPLWLAWIKGAIAWVAFWSAWCGIVLLAGEGDEMWPVVLYVIAAPQLGVVLAAAFVGWLLGRRRRAGDKS